MVDIECVVNEQDVLGECPVWCPREQALYWTDIVGQRLKRYLPSKGEVNQWVMPEQVTSFALREQGGIIASLPSGFAIIDLHDGVVTRLAAPESGRQDNTFNDGKCDRRGRFWAGTRNLAFESHTGALYRLGADRSCQLMESNIGCSNGLAWSPDDRTFYFGDSKDQTIYAYDFDVDSGDISNRRPFATLAREPQGIPDGMTIDQEGFVWSVECYRGRVVRYDPSGHIDRIIEMPIKMPSSAVFGGESLSILYVTSIAGALSPGELIEQPLAGGVFAIDVGVKGLPEPRYAG